MLDPGSRISEQQQQQRGGEKVFVLPFLPKLSTSSQKYGSGDPGSRKNLAQIQGPKKHRIPDPNRQHCFFTYILLRRFSVDLSDGVHQEAAVGVDGEPGVARAVRLSQRLCRRLQYN
jgi:hypothetical protein